MGPKKSPYDQYLDSLGNYSNDKKDWISNQREKLGSEYGIWDRVKDVVADPYYDYQMQRALDSMVEAGGPVGRNKGTPDKDTFINNLDSLKGNPEALDQFSSDRQIFPHKYRPK